MGKASRDARKLAARKLRRREELREQVAQENHRRIVARLQARAAAPAAPPPWPPTLGVLLCPDLQPQHRTALEALDRLTAQGRGRG